MHFLGCDVSYGRTSQSAVVFWEYDPVEELARAYDVKVETLHTQPEVVDFIAHLEEEYSFDGIAVDALNFGKGVLDFLHLKPFANKVVGVVANTRPSKEWEHGDKSTCGTATCPGCVVDKQYANFKSRIVGEMRRSAYRGKVKMIDHDRLREELGQYRMTKVGGRWKVEDPKKSPDVADAALIGYSLCMDSGQTFWLGK